MTVWLVISIALTLVGLVLLIWATRPYGWGLLGIGLASIVVWFFWGPAIARSIADRFAPDPQEQLLAVLRAVDAKEGKPVFYIPRTDDVDFNVPVRFVEEDIKKEVLKKAKEVAVKSKIEFKDLTSVKFRGSNLTIVIAYGEGEEDKAGKKVPWKGGILFARNPQPQDNEKLRLLLARVLAEYPYAANAVGKKRSTYTTPDGVDLNLPGGGQIVPPLP